MNERWYDKTVEQTEEKLNTDVNTGLSPSILHSRQKNDEMNVVFPITRHTFEACLKRIISDPTSIILLLTALIAAVLEQDMAAGVIISLVLFNVLVSVFIYNKAQRIFEDMERLALPTTKVLRNGKMFLIKSEQLVKGDVIYLSAGDMVPADARLVEADGLQVLEVNLTGAVKPVEKDPLFLRYTHDVPPAQQANMVFASTIVIKGTAKAICCCTGDDTLVCKMEKAKPIVPHNNIKAISFMNSYSKYWSLAMILLIFLVVGLMLVFGSPDNGLFDIFLTALSLAAVTPGEFYLMSTYVIVANGLFSAVKQNKHINSGALIKNISKIEDLKKISCLLVHKEGAFSVRDVRAEKTFVNNTLYTFGEVNFEKNASRVLRLALISTGLYGAKNIVKNNLNNENIYTAEEDALISVAQRCGVYNINLDKEYPIVEHLAKGETSRFETTLVNSSEGYTVACRGTLDEILAVCNTYAENGNVYPFTPQKKADIISEAVKLNRQSFRIVAVSSKKTGYNNLRRIISCQSEMVFEGFIAIRERMLPGAAKNIADCQAAGIKVIMLCDDIGDHNRTMAEALGIVKKSEEIINGGQLITMRDELFRTNIPLYRMYEGLSILQKRKLLSLLHEEGEVVGVLGRELEEIILIKESDVGFLQSTTLSGKLDKSGLDMAMAKNTNLPMMVKNSRDSKKTGSEALKFIADVIVSDADRRGNGGFNAIVSSIISSKMIYKNLVRFINYLLTTGLARIFLVICSIFTNNPILSPIQILFTGLVIDFIAMLIITFEHPENRAILKDDTTEELLKVYKNIPFDIISGVIWAASVACLPIILKFLGVVSTDVQTCVVFISFIISQVAVLNEVIKDNSIFRPSVRYNRAHLIMVCTVAAFILVTTFVEAAGKIFGVVKLNWITYACTLIPAVIMILTYELKKIIFNSTKTDK